MAHIRRRHLKDTIYKYLKFSPLVGVFGHRQVGKTTLISRICKSYYTLDDEESLAHPTEYSAEFLKQISGPSPIGLDEIQLMPKLFPALKEWARKNNKPGQFLLSGSVRFTSQKSIRESLTGRIVNVELLPLSINELLELDPPERLKKLHLTQEFSAQHDTPLESLRDEKIRFKTIEQYKTYGGLPGICFVRNDRLRKARLSTQIDTLLDRDLRMIYSTRLSLSELKIMLQNLAAQTGQNLSLSQASPKGRMNSSVLQKIIDAMESLFILRRIPIRGDYSGSTLYFEDIAEYRQSLKKDVTPEILQQQMIFSVTRSSLSLLEDENLFFQFRTRGGSLVPVAVQTKNHVSGFIPIQNSEPSRSENASAHSFLSAIPNSKVFFVHETLEPLKVIDSRKLSCSLIHLSQ